METCGPEDLVFDQSVVTSSFATRFDLVCGKASLNGIFNSCVMLGMLLFSLPIGALADWIGRKVRKHAVSLTLTALLNFRGCKETRNSPSIKIPPLIAEHLTV